MRPPYRYITIRELEYLKEKYPTEPTSRVAETLGKTNRWVIYTAAYYGIKKKIKRK